MQRLARHQRRGGRDQMDIVRRQIAPQIDDPARQHHMRQERQAPRIRFRLGEIQQADAGRLQQHLDQRRIRRRAEHQAVDAAVQQRHRGRRVFQRAECQLTRLDPVDVQQLPEQARHAAAFRADIDLQAFQVGQPTDVAAVAKEQPDRFGKQAAERDQALALGLGLIGRSALHEGDVDARSRVVQALQVFLRAERGFLREPDMIFFQRARIFFGEFFIGAVFLAGGNRQMRWRGRIHQPVRQPAQDGDRQQRRAGGGQKISNRKSEKAEHAGHDGPVSK